MEGILLPFGYIEGLKRLWRRKGYKRLVDDSVRMRRKKIKIASLGRKRNKNNGGRSIHTKEELKGEKSAGIFKFTMMAPTRLVGRLHEAYVDAMIRLAGSKRIDHVENEGKRVAKAKPIPMVSAPTNEVVDSRVVVEMYKRVVSTRGRNAALP